MTAVIGTARDQVQARIPSEAEAPTKPASRAGDLRIAFFINGPDEHGIVRASRVLADALARTAGCTVFVVRSTDAVVSADAIDTYVVPLREADVVVIHASCRTNDLWGAPHERADAIAGFCSRVQRPVVMYLHDVYGETGLASLVKAAKLCMKSVRDPRQLRTSGANLLRKLAGRSRSLESRFIEKSDSCVAGFLVSNQIEQKRLRRHRPRHVAEVVPHFIERRESLIDKADAKERLAVSGRLVVTLLGFIYWRKGHDTALDMLQWLPKHTLLVFAGGAVDKNGPFYQTLLRRIEDRQLRDRVLITGYIDDDELDVYLSATDVAICPFHGVSASGSLSTWLGAGKPIVATDLPLFRLYASEFGDGITLAPHDDPVAFARAVETTSASLDWHGLKIRAVAERYSVENTARRMLACLQRISPRKAAVWRG